MMNCIFYTLVFYSDVRVFISLAKSQFKIVVSMGEKFKYYAFQILVSFHLRILLRSSLGNENQGLSRQNCVDAGPSGYDACQMEPLFKRALGGRTGIEFCGG